MKKNKRKIYTVKYLQYEFLNDYLRVIRLIAVTKNTSCRTQKKVSSSIF